MDWPGPFEMVALASFFYVTPPDADFTPGQAEQALGDFEVAALEVVTIHGAMTGHFVQGLTLAAHPWWTLVRKAAASSATTEGWAQHAEQMVVDEGFGDGDPKLRLMPVQHALLRDCRLLAAFGMHAQGMTGKGEPFRSRMLSAVTGDFDSNRPPLHALPRASSSSSAAAATPAPRSAGRDQTSASHRRFKLESAFWRFGNPRYGSAA